MAMASHLLVIMPLLYQWKNTKSTVLKQKLQIITTQVIATCQYPPFSLQCSLDSSSVSLYTTGSKL